LGEPVVGCLWAEEVAGTHDQNRRACIGGGA
jgi:hypothetical protein